MTMMIWWQNTDPLATYSVQENLTLGLEEAEKKTRNQKHRPATGRIQSLPYAHYMNGVKGYAPVGWIYQKSEIFYFSGAVYHQLLPASSSWQPEHKNW